MIWILFAICVLLQIQLCIVFRVEKLNVKFQQAVLGCIKELQDQFDKLRKGEQVIKSS